MHRILVAFATHYGQTRKIAERLAEHLRGLGHWVELADLRGGVAAIPPPADYDAVVLGSRIEAGRHATVLYEYLRAHHDQLRTRPTAFFSVSMAAARPQAGSDPDGYMRTLFDDLAWEPRIQVAFAGGLPYRKYGWFLRFMMKRISRSAGHTTDTSKNHELTRWDEVLTFASAVSAMLPDHRPDLREVSQAPPA